MIKKIDFFSALFIFFLTVLTLLPLFLEQHRSSNMDGIVHTLVPQLFANAMRQGEFPVTWTDGFANYGLPLGIISHQVTTYLIAFGILLFNSPTIAFNIVAFIGFFFSSLFFYIFLRFYFRELPSLCAVIFFHFAPYRILNIFIRGAIPEFFAGVFIPLILIALYLVIKKKHVFGLFLLSLTVALLILTHPFMLVVGSVLFIPYSLFLLWEEYKSRRRVSLIKNIFLLFIFSVLGVGISSYFFLPLQKEIQYFYYGQSSNHLTPNSYLTIQSYFQNRWEYFTTLDIVHRGFIVNVGILETLVVLFSIIIVPILMLKKTAPKSIFIFALSISLILIFLLSKWSTFLYENIDTLSNVQFQWRMLSSFVFLPPILFAYLLSLFNKKIVMTLLIILIYISAFPQMYGKNHTNFPEGYYHFTPLNLHATVMNTIWSGESDSYPLKKDQGQIIEGDGALRLKEYKNTRREYTISSNDKVKLVDNTFYFPGWNLYIDGKKETIEFQDPKYRGVITYIVPPGNHEILLLFENTKTRQLGLVLSAISAILLLAMFGLHKKVSLLLHEKR